MQQTLFGNLKVHHRAPWTCPRAVLPTQFRISTCQLRRQQIRGHKRTSHHLIVCCQGENKSRRQSPFVKKRIEVPEPPPPTCPVCGGGNHLRCKDCKGSGKLAWGGYHRKNPLNMKKVIGSKWTARETTFGWRHFRAVQKRRNGKESYLLMAATCDEQTQFWLNAKLLRDRSLWASGWLQRIQLESLQSGAECKACRGTGKIACPKCSDNE